jgi:mono/diheme cytochrome c family protein
MRAVLLAIAGAAVLGGCATGGPGVVTTGLDPAVERGQRFAERRCSGCHAIGLDEISVPSGPRFRDLRGRFNPISLERRFAQISQHGSGEMPPIEITPSQAEDLVAYFESLGPR